MLNLSAVVDTKGADTVKVIAFAKKLLGIPYKYVSSTPAEGFECFGFIT